MKKKKRNEDRAMNPKNLQRRSYSERWKVGFGVNMIVMAVRLSGLQPSPAAWQVIRHEPGFLFRKTSAILDAG
jgi:hypothetical protein